MSTHLVSLLFLLLACASSSLAQEKSPGPDNTSLSLLRISPSGDDVPAGREIVFQFSEAVAPVGRMQREAKEVPVQFDPPIHCEWRWVNTASLACQLKESERLKAATKYRILTKDDPEGDEGKRILPAITRYLSAKRADGAPRNEFVTELPKVTSYEFNKWEGPGTPALWIYFSLDVTRASVADHLYFRDAGGSRVRVKISPKKEGETVPESGNVFLISSVTELALDTRAALWVEPGIAPAVEGMPSKEDRVVVEFDTYPEFRFLGVRCCDERFS